MGLVIDHRNLEYLRDANRLNSRQARWALFLTQLHFSISYLSAIKNKADELSCIHSSSESPDKLEPIVSSKILVSLDEDRWCRQPWASSTSVSISPHICFVLTMSQTDGVHVGTGDQFHPLTLPRPALVDLYEPWCQKVHTRLPDLCHHKYTSTPYIRLTATS